MIVRILFILIISFSLHAEDKEILTTPTKTIPEMGPLAAVFLGFGSSSLIQEREMARFYSYAISQGLGFALILSGFGDCMNGDSKCDKNKDERVRLGSILYLGSRLIEVTDSLYFYFTLKPAKSTSGAYDTTPLIGLNLDF